ncbi:MAG TPA: nucleotidyl transferase AbiEii/AbiGii toxin family protein [Polyangiaceae bacterium]|jgi:hypothetical protein
MTGISSAQAAALALVAPALEPGTYLAGGVAAALTLGHRTSIDLDLFVPTEFDQERLGERIASQTPDARVVGRGPGTLHLEVGGVPTSILSYRYPLLAPASPRAELPVPVASLEDLLCMKLSAIAGRGAAKDFWDLDELLARGIAGGSLEGALGLFTRKYATEDVGHVVRSLAYFAEADAAPLPAGLSREAWTALKARVLDRVRRL